jgi:hypothetical protein
VKRALNFGKQGNSALVIANKNSSGRANKMTDTFIAQALGVYTKELGMGVEPIYSSSAGYRLNRSATPASRF